MSQHRPPIVWKTCLKNTGELCHMTGLADWSPLATVTTCDWLIESPTSPSHPTKMTNPIGAPVKKYPHNYLWSDLILMKELATLGLNQYRVTYGSDPGDDMWLADLITYLTLAKLPTL
jgi:hypothetical protein